MRGNIEFRLSQRSQAPRSPRFCESDRARGAAEGYFSRFHRPAARAPVAACPLGCQDGDSARSPGLKRGRGCHEMEGACVRAAALSIVQAACKRVPIRERYAMRSYLAAIPIQIARPHRRRPALVHIGRLADDRLIDGLACAERRREHSREGRAQQDPRHFRPVHPESPDPVARLTHRFFLIQSLRFCRKHFDFLRDPCRA